MQYLANSIVAGAAIGLMALGFSIIYSTARFFHFAHGAVYTLGAYAAFALMRLAGLSPGVGIGLALLVSIAAGGLMEAFVYRVLRRRGANPLGMLVASLGILIAVQNGIALAFGDETRTLWTGPVEQGYRIAGAAVTPIQLVAVASSVGVLAAVSALWHFSSLGLRLRALASDPELAVVVGLRPDRLILVTFLVGSGAAGLAGILAGYDTDLTPAMGFRALLGCVVAAVVGGLRGPTGAMLGGLLVGALQQGAVLWLPSEWQSAVMFGVLVVVLLVRPQGLLGRA